MPIKFRCSHCRQLLGISRGKAGQPVDCPSCGRTVRVPNLDGKVDPVSAPGLNMEDARLVQALDQLALIGQLPPDERDAGPEFAPVGPEPAFEASVPAPAPQPVVVAAPLPARVVEPRSSGAASSAGLPTPGGGAAELESLARMAPAAPTSSPSATAGTGGLLILSAVGLTSLLIGFATGFVVGRGGGGFAPPSTAAVVAPEAPQPAAAAPAGERKAAIRGRITYRTESGESRADVGARVIALPEKRAGEFRLPVTGFRAADSPVDFQVGLAALRALGGDVAIVGDEGQYELSLPGAGNYHVLVLSRFQSEPNASPPAPGVKSLLDAWFSRSDQLLGRVRHHLGQIRYAGDEPKLYDHSFERAG